MQKNRHLSQLQLDEFMLCINSQIQPEGQHSAVDRFLGRSVINFIPNSFNDQFVWQDAIRARAEVRERRVNKPSRGCKETFSPGQQVILQDHISRKWDIPGQISKLRQAPHHQMGKFSLIKFWRIKDILLPIIDLWLNQYPMLIMNQITYLVL